MLMHWTWYLQITVTNFIHFIVHTIKTLLEGHVRLVFNPTILNLSSCLHFIKKGALLLEVLRYLTFLTNQKLILSRTEIYLN